MGRWGLPSPWLTSGPVRIHTGKQKTLAVRARLHSYGVKLKFQLDACAWKHLANGLNNDLSRWTMIQRVNQITARLFFKGWDTKSGVMVGRGNPRPLGGGGCEIRSSRLFLATYWIWSYPGLHEILSQKQTYKQTNKWKMSHTLTPYKLP